MVDSSWIWRVRLGLSPKVCCWHGRRRGQSSSDLTHADCEFAQATEISSSKVRRLGLQTRVLGREDREEWWTVVCESEIGSEVAGVTATAFEAKAEWLLRYSSWNDDVDLVRIPCICDVYGDICHSLNTVLSNGALQDGHVAGK